MEIPDMKSIKNDINKLKEKFKEMKKKDQKRRQSLLQESMKKLTSLNNNKMRNDVENVGVLDLTNGKELIIKLGKNAEFIDDNNKELINIVNKNELVAKTLLKSMCLLINNLLIYIYIYMNFINTSTIDCKILLIYFR